MKKVISLLVAVLILACGIVSVSAEISPTAPIVGDKITIDAVPVPDNAGSVTPDIDNPFEYIIGSDGTVKLVASTNEGFKFVRWEFVTGEFDIIEGSLTSPTITILPKGNANIRAYAHFVKDGETVPSEPDTKPVTPPDDGDKSPITGQPVAMYSAAAAVVLMIGFAVIALKKKAC